MRLAILSALPDQFGQSGAGLGERKALRRFAGKPVIAHQIDLVALLGCERILCLAGSRGPDLATTRTYAERFDLRFDLVDSIPHLLSIVTAEDDVIVLADGILPDRESLMGAMSDQASVVSFPVDPALELGFERLDAERAWSGALRMPGGQVAQLADLSPDCDLGSSLLRIALQSGVGISQLGSAPLADGTWLRRIDAHTASGAEERWIASQIQPAPFAAPGQAIVERIALRLAQDAVGGRWDRAPHLFAVIMGVLAVIGGLVLSPMLGLGLLAGAVIALEIAGVFDRLEALGAPQHKNSLTKSVARWLLDGILVGLLALSMTANPDWLRVVLPIQLIALLHLAARSTRGRASAIYRDRITLLLLLLIVAAQGWVTVVVAGLSIVASGQLLWLTRQRSAQITAS